jgi:hypothetical protein
LPIELNAENNRKQNKNLEEDKKELLVFERKEGENDSDSMYNYNK